MKIVIRTDSSTKIGSGHLMRCLTFAEEIIENGHEVFFVCRELEGNLIDLVKQKGFEVHILPRYFKSYESDREVAYSKWLEVDWQRDLRETKEYLTKINAIDWIIVDHYALDYKWESGIREHTKKIMIIDDLADRKHDCDLLLDQNLYRDMQTRYYGLVPLGCRLLLGPKNILLRKEFKVARESLRLRDGSIKNILIFFGGVDPMGETEKAILALDELDSKYLELDVVVGASNPDKDRIRKLCLIRPNSTFHCQVKNMASLISKADLAIGAGGTTIWERGYLGLPSILKPVAENQRLVLEYLSELGLVRLFNGSEELIRLVNSLISDSKSVKELSANMLKMFQEDLGRETLNCLKI